MSRQLAITKGLYTLQSRSITWISVKTLKNLDINSLFKIDLDRQLPNGLISLDVLHDIKSKQPQELIIPLLNTANTDIKFSKKSPTDFGRTKLVEMNLPPTSPHVATKPYSIPLKCKSFIDEEIKLLEDARCISKSLSDWASLPYA